MTRPLGFPDPQPQYRANWLGRYLNVEKKFDDRLRNILLDALSGIDEAFGDLDGKFSSQVRRQQLSLSNKEIRRTIRGIFGGTGNLIREYRQDAAMAAVEAKLYDERGILSKLFPEVIQRGQYADSLRQSARRNIESVITRVLETEKPLSQRVYRSEALANGQISQAINRALARGDSAKNLADSVKHLINPDTPGGISYAAKRLGRTEINNAFHAQSIHDAQESPWVERMSWNLSKRHEVPDECTEYAQIKYFDIENVPEKPHPNCRCFVTPEQPDYQTFENDLIQGKYDEHLDKILDESIESSTAREELPQEWSKKLQVEIDKKGPGKEIYPWKGISSTQRKELNKYNSLVQAKNLAAEQVASDKAFLEGRRKIVDDLVPESIDKATNSKQVQNYLLNNYEGLEVSGFDTEDIDPRAAKEIATAFVDRQAKSSKTNIRALRIVEDLPDGVNAETRYNKDGKRYSDIVFNRKAIANYDSFKANAKSLTIPPEGFKTGYFNAAARDSERPWYSTTTHEWGHVLDFSGNLATSKGLDPEAVNDYLFLKGEKQTARTGNGLLDRFLNLYYPSDTGTTLSPEVRIEYEDWILDNLSSGYSFKDKKRKKIEPIEATAEGFLDFMRNPKAHSVSKSITQELMKAIKENDDLKVIVKKR